MYKLIVEYHYTGEIKNYYFNTLYDAEKYLIEEGFTYDDYDEDDNVFYWTQGHFTYGELSLI